MKRTLTLLCALLLAMLPLWEASAITQEEWNQKCRYKAGASIILYAIDVADDGTKTTRAIETIPSGAYISIGGTDYDLQMRLVVFFKDGRQVSGYIHRDEPLIDATKTIHFTDGTAVTIPEAIADNPSALQSWIDRHYPGKKVYGDGSTPVNVDGTQPLDPSTSGSSDSGSSGNTVSSGNSGTSNGSATKSRSNQSAAPSGLTTTLKGSTVAVSQLGVYQSCVIIDGEEAIVLTADLIFAEDVPADKAIAVIYAPNTGKCTLRQKASDSAKSLGKCKAGAIVAVLEYGRKYCKISYDGEVGYVLTSCLKFYGEADAPSGTGTLTYNGKATGRTTINVRNAADGDAHKIAEWRTGTEVSVFGKDSDWYEIEHAGMHGFVHEDYLTIGE